MYASIKENRYHNEQTGAKIDWLRRCLMDAVSDVRYYSLDLSVAKPIGDAPVESASRSPRINATFSYQLN